MVLLKNEYCLHTFLPIIFRTLDVFLFLFPTFLQRNPSLVTVIFSPHSIDLCEFCLISFIHTFEPHFKLFWEYLGGDGIF